jgi:putative transcriptional regulator
LTHDSIIASGSFAMNTFFEDLLESVQEMDGILRGERKASRMFHVDPAAIRQLRETTGLSQAKFALLLDVDVGTLRNWEQGRRAPTGPARALLRAIGKDPHNVLAALA